MRVLLLRCVMLAILAAMFGGHVTELFDHWDHTLRTGKDADYTVVFIAASVGAIFAVSRPVLSACAQFLLRRTLLDPLLFWLAPHSLLTEVVSTGPSPPLLAPIRI